MSRFYAIAGVAAVAGLLGGVYFASQPSGGEDVFAQCRTSKTSGIGGSKLGGPLELVDENGETVTDKEIIPEMTLLYFGYTFCPDVCPLDSARNTEAVELLEAQGRSVSMAFVSVDTGRDTPETMKDFTDLFHPKMLGLTGSPEQIKAASRAYATYFKVNNDDPEDEYYLVDHSTSTYLVDPKHGFLQHFGRTTTPEEMAKTVACYMDAAS